MAKCLVTGSSGFIAGHLIQALREQGDVVTGADKKTGMDLTDGELCCELVDGMDVVYHLASETNLSTSFEFPERALGDDLLTTVNLLEASRDSRSDIRFIFTSSAAIYGHSLSQKISEEEVLGDNIVCPYGVNKRAAEIYTGLYRRVHGLSTVCLRLFNVYGPGQMNLQAAIPSFTLSILRGNRIQINGDGMQSRDFVHVKDVVKALMLMGKSRHTGVYNVGTGVSHTLLNLLLMLVNVSGKKLFVDHVPQLQYDIRHSCANISRILRLGWEPELSLKEGLKDTIEFYKQVGAQVPSRSSSATALKKA